jgi:hypothetical protein
MIARPACPGGLESMSPLTTEDSSPPRDGGGQAKFRWTSLSLVIRLRTLHL